LFRFCFKKTVKNANEVRFERALGNVKKCVLKMHLEKCETLWKTWKITFEIQLGRWNSDFFLQV